MIEFRRAPRVRRMTLRAFEGQAEAAMIRIVRAFIDCAVTIHALRGRSRILPGRVALAAGRHAMRARQREARQVVIESRRSPLGRPMTLPAFQRQIQRFMIWIDRRRIIRSMAGIAFRRHIRIAPCVAAIANVQRMSAAERKG